MNIFLNKTIGCAKLNYFIPAVLIFVCCVHPTHALDSNRTFSQYIHNVWGSENGFTGGTIYAITQTADGYLWIGTEKGLIRFDGLEFKSIQLDASNLITTESVIGLLPDAAGNLWIQLSDQNTLLYHHSLFERVFIHPGKVKLHVNVMSKSKTSEFLFSTPDYGTVKYNGKEFEPVIGKKDMPVSNVISMAGTADGDIWLGTRDKGLAKYSENETKTIIDGLPNLKINCLLPDGEHDLLVGTDEGIVRWNGQQFITPAGLEPLKKSQIVALLKDRDSVLWIATSAQGIWRLTNEKAIPPENYDPRSDNAVTTMFEDREGNIWFGTSHGIERLRESAFTTYSIAEGAPAENNGPIFVDSENRIWFAPDKGGLYYLQNNEIKEVPFSGDGHDVIYSITGTREDLWLGRQNGGLTHLHLSGTGYTAENFTQSAGLAQNNVYAVRQGHDGSIWAGTLSGGISHLKDGKFNNYTTADGLALNTVTAIEEGLDGTMWFATPAGISAFNGQRWQTFKNSDGLPSDTVNSLLEDSRGILWIGTGKGLAFYNLQGIQVPSNLPALANENILGIAEDKQGSLWISTSNKVLQVNRDNLLNGTINDNDIRQYGLVDGLKGVEAVKRNQNVMADSMGRIWFSLNRGISVVDPNRLKSFSLPALVQIQSVSADAAGFNLQEPINISFASQQITVKFAALSLSIPERIKYRFRLEGLDTNWSEPSSATEMTYTNLAPGTYKFRVIATNSEGLWNSTPAVVEIKVTPVFWQTWWFLFLCLIAAVFIIICLFRLRLYQLRRQIELRFEERLAERLAERQRLAHELHDTLLQGVYSASIQLDFVVEELAGDSSMKPILHRVLQLLGHVMIEGRQTLKGLDSRKSDKLFILEETFSQLKDDFDRRGQTDFRIIVKEATQTLDPLIRDELYRIGREAIINAFRHSKASRIEVEIEYAAQFFKLLIRDNGVGLDPEILRTGRDGHFGLSGMRACAERIGAKLETLNSADGGLIIELTVPNHIAYENQSSAGLYKWLNFLQPKNKTKISRIGKYQKPNGK